jgi:hypothetical protein
MGPGGRLRPAPRAHRNLPRTDGPRPTGYPGPHAPDSIGTGGGLGASSTSLLGRPDDEILADDMTTGHALAHLEDFDLDDEMTPDAPHTVIGQELDAGPDETSGEAVMPSVPLVRQPAPQQRFDRRPAAPGPMGGPRPQPERQDRGDRVDRAAPSCTAPQLRRFIKSRAYVPMHELRRRFAIDGGDDDVTGVELESGRIFVGLPAQEGQLLGDLLRGGEVGFELSLDPRTPIVVGVYAMRPVPRP